MQQYQTGFAAAPVFYKKEDSVGVQGAECHFAPIVRKNCKEEEWIRDFNM